MINLYFNTQAEAITAMATINGRLGIPDEHGTTTWANIKPCVNGTWTFIKPECDLGGLPEYTEKEFDKVTDLGLGNSASDADG
jgi:hypothetical protein